MATLQYKLLQQFRSLFENTIYRHRSSTNGDRVASFLIDDMYAIKRSSKLAAAIDDGLSVIDAANKTTGKTHRRGDGTFGAVVPGVDPVPRSGYVVQFGKVANVEIGTEMKIMAKAMIKQLDRVCSDMKQQAAQFRKHGNDPVCVGLFAVNYAPTYVSFEGERDFPTDGKKYAHPIDEAASAEARLIAEVAPHYDELIVLRFAATNQSPGTFAWVDEQATVQEYGAALVRLCKQYDRRF
ncbi:hypothetical protein [Paraburkholderia terrae]|uniref:hypothetical protein n=1 Tax=Paraburkholderia terrae TaxID=311230 RepID=UPI002066ADDB|nr:hypothetical protein [Paraburkholderia terrae]BDC46142.1 hypothetical protein PTKU15_94390 [Paraburkholderia terrae]